jgi:hypothetical protein
MWTLPKFIDNNHLLCYLAVIAEASILSKINEESTMKKKILLLAVLISIAIAGKSFGNGEKNLTETKIVKPGEFLHMLLDSRNISIIGERMSGCGKYEVRRATEDARLLYSGQIYDKRLIDGENGGFIEMKCSDSDNTIIVNIGSS